MFSTTQLKSFVSKVVNMKITKTKLAAASFGAALTSLYSAPELCAQVDTIDSNADLTFMPGTVPFFTGDGSADYGVEVAVGGVTSFGSPALLNIIAFNNGDYGFGAGNRFGIANGAQEFFELSPGDVFDGSTGGGVGQLSVTGTGVRTFGFISEFGQVGYFRVMLSVEESPGVFSPAIFLDGEVAVLDANGENDFTVTVPDGDDPVVIVGDVNMDGSVDFFDIQPFIDALAGGFQAEADIDGNGEVNFFDIAPFIELLSNGGMQLSMSDSNGKPLEMYASNTQDMEQLIRAIELKLNDEIAAAVLGQTNSSLTNNSPSVGLASLASGADGLLRRRKAVTA